MRPSLQACMFTCVHLTYMCRVSMCIYIYIYDDDGDDDDDDISFIKH